MRADKEDKSLCLDGAEPARQLWRTGARPRGQDAAEGIGDQGTQGPDRAARTRGKLMDRFAVIAIFTILVGVWVRPYLIGAAHSQPVASDPMVVLGAPAAPDGTTAEAAVAESADAGKGLGQAEPGGPTTAPVLSDVHGTAGFWRLAQTPDGVWWFVSPTDRLEFLNTVTTVQPYQLGRDKAGPHFVSRDWPAPAGDPHQLDDWATKTLARVKETGFKGIGAWSNPVFHKLDVPMSQDLNLWTFQKEEGNLFYSADWETTAESAVALQCAPLKENRNLIGYFIDNELDWGDQFSGPARYFDRLPSNDPNRRQVISVIQSVWTTLDKFNHDWKLHLKDWSDLDAWATLPQDQPVAYSRLFTAWLGHLAGDYFRETTTLIHKYDPNHLILGVRFKGYAPREVVRASRGYTDAQSINYYVGDARLDAEMFAMMNAESQQPIIISEYSFHSLDGRSGDRDTVGFPAQVLDQQARADAYRQFTTRLADVPFIVGADWFQWADEPPSGREHDGEDANFGIVDVDDHPYPLLASAVAATRDTLDPLHAHGGHEVPADVWRQSFANRPLAHMPYVGNQIVLNGELSDWPASAKLSGIRRGETVGLDRSKLPVPDVYLGWSDAGLYLAFQVYDHDIDGAPANGWWWTKDYVEFWVRTRPTAADQNAYDPYSAQFFFVPNNEASEDGSAGTVGQWHRPGDALKDNLIPQPDIRQAARILPGSYVVEMFIPAKALPGWDPRYHPAIAFNMHAHDYQHALDYFWSAPKEVLTQLRPNSWGTVILDSAAKNVQGPAVAATGH